MKTPAEQIRKVCEDVEVDESVYSILGRFNALADHLESEPPAGTKGTGLKYPVELRCAELEEKMKALNGYLRHHDTCLKAMRYKNTGFDDTAPCDCGLEAALAKGEKG